MTTPRRPFRLFDGVGVEVEYAIVDQADLSVRPIADTLLRDEHGDVTEEIERAATCWSNELTAHVVELKTRGPTTDLEDAWGHFARDVVDVNDRLARSGAHLMPTAMHPLMRPDSETHLWPHGNNDIYSTYDRIFGCSGHGFANVQSMHLNLPFTGDAEFARLHAAIRVVLPLLPALASSSPIAEGKVTGRMDTRLWHYRRNQRAIPAVTGRVIPEQVFSEAAYGRTIFEPISQALRPLDPDGVLEAEWVNSRGAIARFSRGSIEIRLLDTQECPRMDFALAAWVVAVLRALVDERLSEFEAQKTWTVDRLSALLGEAESRGSEALFTDRGYAELFGMRQAPTHAIDIVQHLAGKLAPAWAAPALAHLAERGCLARRILEATGPSPEESIIRQVYEELCRCLQDDRWFSG